MLLLVLDTSGRLGFVALARADGTQLSVIEEVPLAGGTFSAQLVPQIAELLAKHGFGKGDIGAFIVIAGPGSFTGLRVGLAAIKALAEILQKPIVAVSLLEVMAAASGVQGKVMAAVDAGRGEVYCGEFVVGERVREELLSQGEFVERSRGVQVVIADQSLAAARDAGLTVVEIGRPRAEQIARVGWKKFGVGQTTSPEELDADYMRRSDAEIFAKAGS